MRKKTPTPVNIPKRNENLLAAHIHPHRLSILDSGRHRYGDALSLHCLALASTLQARVFDVHPRTLTVAARRTHHKRPRRNGFHPSAIAVLTLARLGARFAPRSRTLGARIDHIHVDVLVDASGSLGKGKIHHHLLCPAEPKLGVAVIVKTRLKAPIAEDLAEQLLRIDGRTELPVLGESLRPSTRSWATARTAHLLGRLSVRVVLTALCFIAQNLRDGERHRAISFVVVFPLFLFFHYVTSVFLLAC